MEPADEAAPNAAPTPLPPDPFAAIRARTVVEWVVVWFVVTPAATMLGGSIELLIYTLYPLLLGWVAYESWHHGLRIQDFIGRPAFDAFDAFDAFRRLWPLLPTPRSP